MRDGFTAVDANTGAGQAQNTPDFCEPVNPDPACNKKRYDDKTADATPKFVYGMHESYDYYERCYTRERQKGLFAADRQLNNAPQRGATVTRQNTNGNNVRNGPSQANNANHGYECPEGTLVCVCACLNV